MEGETWLEAAQRLSSPWGLESEIKMWYEKFIQEGYTEELAALYACYEWDVCLICDEEE